MLQVLLTPAFWVRILVGVPQLPSSEAEHPVLTRKREISKFSGVTKHVIGAKLMWMSIRLLTGR